MAVSPRRRPKVAVDLEANRVAAEAGAHMGLPGSGQGVPVVINGTPGQTVFGPDLNNLDARSVDNKAMQEYWTKVHDIVNGAETMRAGHERYLPQFPNEDPADYDFRWKHSKFTNVYRDIVENLASKPFEQEVTVIDPNPLKPGEKIEDHQSGIPEPIAQFVEDVDGSGNNLTVFAADTFFNGINSAIDWIFVDYSQTDGQLRSIADERRLGIRPYWSHVLGSNVLDVRSRVITGKERLYYIRIQEFEPTGKFIRIMRADETSAAWELYRETSGNASQKYEFVASGPITINEIPMVPFVTGRRKGRSWQFLPVMKDAAELQIELYQQESGLKNIETLAGFPMLSGEGVEPQTIGTGNSKRAVPLKTGPNTTLYGGTNGKGSPGKWSFISPDAAIMQFLLAHVEKTTDELRELGRQPLTAQSGNLTVITTMVAAKKGNSAVQMWGFALKNALENALVLTAKWFNINPETYSPEINVYTDFEVEGQETDLSTLTEARKNRDISQATYWHELQRRGVLSGEFDTDKEKELLLLEAPDDEDLDADNPSGNSPVS